ncbi:MAG: hypothetical protein IPP09_06075 [Elusimicrobia bacterium]|nr:hypothetical protein [Elusimicrobiota bacterium]MBK9922717.1 hypothetical protein [Elusimicrobiota bacterium]MBL0250620.1 hypothetical protein [Elusimicrobiota bacterium]MBL0361450.1 hypothetical protein [Elusimicrobiota bacterium]
MRSPHAHIRNLATRWGAVLLCWGAAGAGAFEPRFSDLSIEESLGGAPAPPIEGGLFDFNPAAWDRLWESAARTAPPIVHTSTKTAQPLPAPENAPGFTVDLPYESGLSISGRKLIALKLQQTRRKSAKRAEELGVPQSQSDVEMKQELQVRIKGQVGRKITVNVDFDDTKDDKRDISVVYTGDPEEFVQEAAFGDITLSLPATEFVSYSKQLFGVRTRLKYKNAQLLAIGSRTKGTTETKRFNGATRFERRIIRDVDFVKKQYYDVAFTTRAIRIGTEIVYRDDRLATNDVTVTTLTAVDFGAPAVQYVDGRFDRLKPGDDYVVDYARGVLQFKRRTDDNAVYAIDYRFNDDGSLLSNLGAVGPKIVKTQSDQPLSLDPAEIGYRRELKTFYQLGNIKIVRDNGRGNFILRTIDLNQRDLLIQMSTSTESGTPSGEVLEYPNTLDVDFDQGVFNIALTSAVADPQLYGPSPTPKFSFLTEYRYRLRDYQLRPNIVFGSERVSINGRTLKSDVDYFIAYDIGLLQFFNDDQLDENSQIEVTYDYAPFGGQLGQTLVGTRFDLGIVPGRFQAGSTFLYTFAPKTQIIPDIRSAPSSLMVLEADGKVSDLRLPLTPAKLNLTAEVAQSRENPNLFGKALIDSMEGIAQEDAVSLQDDAWIYGVNPAGYAPPTRPSSFVLVRDEDEPLRNVVGVSADVSEDEQLRVLRVDYNLGQEPGGGGTDPEESSLVQAISKAGRDFSKKVYIEFWVQGAGAGAQPADLEIDAGAFAEDTDGDALPGNRPESEDLNSDGTLNEGEDIGWLYNALSENEQIGEDNGRVDTEDLDGDGVLRPGDAPARAGVPLLRLSALPPGTSITNRNGLDDPVNHLAFDGWRFIRMPLGILPAEQDAFKAIRQVRLTFRAQTPYTGIVATGTVRVGKIAFVGNAWETPTVSGGATMSVGAVNNLDNPDYETLLNNGLFGDLYGDQVENRTREQALELRFTLPVGSTATTRTVYGVPRNFSSHNDLRFFYQAPPGSSTDMELFFHLGTETDYFEIPFPTSPADDFWSLATVRLIDLNNDGTPDTLRSVVDGRVATVVGAPNLNSIGQFKIGVRNNSAAPVTGVLWINEIHVSGARNKVGNARRFALDGAWGNWANFGGVFRSVDRNFQTLTSPVVNQDKEETTAFFNLNRWQRNLPLSGTYSKSLTLTPATLRTGQSQLESVLTEGRAETVRARADGQLLFSAWPSLAYGAENTLEELTDRQERRDRNVYNGSLDYAVPGRLDLLPGKKFSFRPLPENIFVKYIRTNYFLSFFPERKAEQLAASTSTVAQENAIFANARTLEFSDEWTGRMSFQPWTGFSFTPNFGRKKVVEQRRFTEAELAFAPAFTPTVAYDKSLSQNHGVSLSWRVFRWLEPRLSYTLSGTETTNLPTVSSPSVVGFKILERQSTGDLYWNLAPRDLLPKWGVVRSLNIDTSFKIDASDTHDNVLQRFTDWQRVQPFRLDKITRRGGRAMMSLLPRLDFNDAGVLRRQLTARNTLRVAGNWSPLDWVKFPKALGPLNTLSVSNTITDTNEHTESTLTLRDVHTIGWLDMIASIRDLEKPFPLRKWVSGAQVNTRLNRRYTETFFEEEGDSRAQGVDLRFTHLGRYDWFLSWNRTAAHTLDLRTGIPKSDARTLNHSAQVGTRIGHWRLTPSATYRSDFSRDGTGRLLQDLDTLTGAVTGRYDRAYPGGFRFPFTKKVFSNVNRLTLDAKVSFERKSSSLNFERDNTDTYAGETTGEWEIARNFRFSFGGKLSVVTNRARSDDGSMSLEMNSQLVIQF